MLHRVDIGEIANRIDALKRSADLCWQAPGRRASGQGQPVIGQTLAIDEIDPTLNRIDTHGGAPVAQVNLLFTIPGGRSQLQPFRRHLPEKVFLG